MKTKNENNYPKISIVIPSYNKGLFLEETLLSIVNQKYPNLELIIQDGGSLDDSVNIIKKFAKKYSYIQWLSKRDKGQVDAINKGFKKSTGIILGFINADDIYSPNALFEVANAYLKNPDSLWFTGFGNIINSEGKSIASGVTNYKNALINLSNYQLLLAVNYITQPSTFLTKSTYQKYGPFTGTSKYVMEYEMWLKLGKVKMPTVITKNLSSFRLTNNNISAISFMELLKLDNQIVKKYTNNKFIYFLHQAHNIGRIGIILLSKK